MTEPMRGRANAAPSSRPRPAPRARPPLRVAPARRGRLRARLLVWTIAAVTVASLFLLVAFHALAAQASFSLDRLDKARTNEQLRYERLRDQVARDSSAPAVIAAATKLGMVPGQGQTVLPGSTSVTTTATPVPANFPSPRTKQALGDNNP